mmetsp:Transcript_10469/g.13573  ORF Transcript_10469/g.13573 Transcript_10469/m.13573 type:complete len:512 (+) Transcript_10469:86-1621(+)
MNLELIDPFQKPVPDRIECTLSYFGNEENGDSDDEEDCDDEIATCCAFNRHGSYLLVGYATGDIVIWDFYTRGIAREIQSHTQAVTVVGWSRDGRHIYSAAMDGRLHAWSLENQPPTLIWTLHLGEPPPPPNASAAGEEQAPAREGEEDGDAIVSARCHPAELGCLVCCTENGKAYKVNLVKGEKTQFLRPADVKQYFKANKIKNAGNKTENLIKTVSIDKEGSYIFAGNGKGRILVLDMKTLDIIYTISVHGCSTAIDQIEFSKDGNWFLVNSNDRSIRMFEKHNNDGYCTQEFQDVVNRVRWRKCCFSADNEHVVAATKDDYQYLLYVWSTSGQLVQTLVGPKEGMLALGWHPWRTFLAVCLLDGNVNIWSNDTVTNWSAFAPDFQELQENIEYIEKEDEFDIVADDPGIAQKKQAAKEEEADVDIETLGKVAIFESDSEDDIFYLYTNPVQNIKLEDCKSNTQELHKNSNNSTVTKQRLETLESKDEHGSSSNSENSETMQKKKHRKI